MSLRQGPAPALALPRAVAAVVAVGRDAVLDLGPALADRVVPNAAADGHAAGAADHRGGLLSSRIEDGKLRVGRLRGTGRLPRDGGREHHGGLRSRQRRGVRQGRDQKRGDEQQPTERFHRHLLGGLGLEIETLYPEGCQWLKKERLLREPGSFTAPLQSSGAPPWLWAHLG